MDFKTYKKLRKKVEAMDEAGSKCPKCGDMLGLTNGGTGKVRLHCIGKWKRYNAGWTIPPVKGCGYESEEIIVD